MGKREFRGRGLTWFLGILFLTLAVSSSAMTLDEFFHSRKDIPENISKWSGNSDKVWILREWIKITTERGDDYSTAVKILRELEGRTPAPPAPGSPPAAGAGDRPPSWDSRLDQLGVKYVPATVQPGQIFWKLIEARWEDEQQSQGRHHIYFEPLNEDGSRDTTAVPLVLHGGETDRVPNENKPPPEFAANYAMWGGGLLGAYTGCMDGLPSDRVEGMGMGDLQAPKHAIHTSFWLKFKKTKASGSVGDAPAPEPGEESPLDGFGDPAPDDVGGSECAPIENERYGTIGISGSPSDRPAVAHPDINLAIRGYQNSASEQELIDLGGDTDAKAPKLRGLFADGRVPRFPNAYKVYEWDWRSMSRAGLSTKWDVSLLGMSTSAGETLHLPKSGYEIGEGRQAMVLYAAPGRITLKYTREDNVVSGYTIHIEGVAIEPRLLALYNACNSEGRSRLPALSGGQAFGRAGGSEIKVAIRDTGEFMDPRVRKDWW